MTVLLNPILCIKNNPKPNINAMLCMLWSYGVPMLTDVSRGMEIKFGKQMNAGAPLLTWIRFNPSMDKWLHAQ